MAGRTILPYLLLASLAVFLRGRQAFVRPLVGALSFRRGLRRLADHAPALLAPPCRHRWRGALGRQPAGAGGGRLRGRPGAGRPGPGRPLGSLGDVAAEARRWREGGGASSLGGHAGGPDFQRPFLRKWPKVLEIRRIRMGFARFSGLKSDFRASAAGSLDRTKGAGDAGRAEWPAVGSPSSISLGFQPSFRPSQLFSALLLARRASKSQAAHP